jgi:hypothetical protein
MGTTPLGGLIVGLVIDAASPRAAVGLGATSAILVGLLMMLYWRLARQTPSLEQPGLRAADG